MVNRAAAPPVGQLRRKGWCPEVFDRMLEIVRRDGDGAVASRRGGALRLLSRVWASGVDVVANEALVELNEVTRKSAMPTEAPLWTFPHPSQTGVGATFYEEFFNCLFDALGADVPETYNLPMPEKPKYDGEKPTGILRTNCSNMLVHAVRYWPWAVGRMLSAAAYDAAEMHSALTQVLTWDEPPRAGKRTWPCADELWIAEYRKVIVLLLSPPHSLLPRNWNSPTAMRWYYDLHGKDPNLHNAPTSGWNVTSTVDDDGIELCRATDPDEDWTKDAAKLGAAIDVDNPHIEEEEEEEEEEEPDTPKYGALLEVKEEEEDDMHDDELATSTAQPAPEPMAVERTDSVTECGSPRPEEEEAPEAEEEEEEGDDAVRRVAAAEAATWLAEKARSRARLARLLLRLPLVVGWWWRRAGWRRDRAEPRLTHGHMRLRIYLKDPMKLELERIALFAVEIFPGIQHEVDKVLSAPRYLVKTRIDRIQGLIDRASELRDRDIAREQRRLLAIAASRERDDKMELDASTDPDVPITRQRRGVTHVEFVCAKNHAAVRTTAACNGHCSRCHGLVVSGAQIIECKGCLPNAVPWWACGPCMVHCGYDPAKPLVRKPVSVKDSKRAFDPGPEPVGPRPRGRQRTSEPQPKPEAHATAPPPKSPTGPAPWWEGAPPAQPLQTTRRRPINVADEEMPEDLVESTFNIEVHPSIEGDGDMDTQYVMHYRLNNVTVVRRLMHDVCKRLGVHRSVVRFVFDGNLMRGNDEMAEDYTMGHDDIVDVFLPAWCRERPPLGLHVYEKRHQPDSPVSPSPPASPVASATEQHNDPTEDGIEIEADVERSSPTHFEFEDFSELANEDLIDAATEGFAPEPAPAPPAPAPRPARFYWRADQKKILEKIYWEAKIPYPSRAQKMEYADMLKVEYRSVDNWFQSRRGADRLAAQSVQEQVAVKNFTVATGPVMVSIALRFGVQPAHVQRLFDDALRQKEGCRRQRAEEEEDARRRAAEETAQASAPAGAPEPADDGDEISDKVTCVRVVAPLNVKAGDRVEWQVQNHPGPGFVFTMPPFEQQGVRPTLKLDVNLAKRFDDVPASEIRVVNVRIDGEGSSNKPISLDEDEASAAAPAPAPVPAKRLGALATPLNDDGSKLHEWSKHRLDFDMMLDQEIGVGREIKFHAGPLDKPTVFVATTVAPAGTVVSKRLTIRLVYDPAILATWHECERVPRRILSQGTLMKKMTCPELWQLEQAKRDRVAPAPVPAPEPAPEPANTPAHQGMPPFDLSPNAQRLAKFAKNTQEKFYDDPQQQGNQSALASWADAL